MLFFFQDRDVRANSAFQIPAYFATFGKALGIRAIAFSRFTFGRWVVLYVYSSSESRHETDKRSQNPDRVELDRLYRMECHQLYCWRV